MFAQVEARSIGRAEGMPKEAALRERVSENTLLLGSSVNTGKPVSSKCARIRWMASYALVKGFPALGKSGERRKVRCSTS
jgi:hypothetical protein